MLASSVVFFPRLRGTSQRARSPLGAHACSGAPATCSCPSRLRKPAASGRALGRPTPAKRSSRTRRARRPPPVFFSGPPHALERPTDRRLADPHPRDPPQVLASFEQRGSWASFQVRLQEQPRLLADLRWRAGPLLRGEGRALAGQPSVALNRGEADPEQAGHLALAYGALFDCFDYLPA